MSTIGGVPHATRPRAPSPWRSPSFYLAVPLTFALLAALFAIRVAVRLHALVSTLLAARGA